MASNFEAVSFANVVSVPKARSFQWRRVIPLALLVAIVAAFATPLFGFALLAAVLLAPVLVTAGIVLAVRSERAT